MSVDIFDGDVALFLTEDGGQLRYSGGQPKMDPGGLETAVTISLFTDRGWCGNFLDQNIGSDFERTITAVPITAQTLRDINEAGQDALQWMLTDRIATTVTVNATSPTLNRIDVDIEIIRIEGVTVNIYYQLNWIAGVLRPVLGTVI